MHLNKLKTVALMMLLMVTAGVMAAQGVSPNQAGQAPATSQTEVPDNPTPKTRTTRDWWGAVSSDWGNPANWIPSGVPSSIDYLTITGDRPFDPVVGASGGVCASLSVTSSGILTLGGNLSVAGNVSITGQLVMSAGVIFDVNGILNWQPGASADIRHSGAEIVCSGSVYFTSGSSVQFARGSLGFDGSGDSTLCNNSPTTRLSSLKIMKTVPGIFSFSGDSTADLTIAGTMYNSAGSRADCNYSNNVILRGDLYDYNATAGRGLRFGSGTLVLDGASQAIACVGPDAFLNHLTISPSAQAYLTTDLTVKGSLRLESGIFNANGLILKVGGNWTNTVGSGGFAPGTGTVVFNQAGGYQDVNGETTFHNLTDAHTGETLRIFAFVEVQGTLTATHSIQLSGGAELNILDNSHSYAAIVFTSVVAYTINSYLGGGTLRTQIYSQLTILDLAQPGLFGAWYVQGSVVVHQDSGQFFDINGRLEILGSLDLYGGTDEMWVASSAIAEIRLSGTLTVRDLNFRMEPTDFGFIYFGGGTIRCYHDWKDYRGVFNPYGGAVEFLGDANSTITAHPSSNFPTLRIAKTAPRDGSGTPEPLRLRDGAEIIRQRNADVSISACVIKGGLDIVYANTVAINGDIQSLNVGSNIICHTTLSLNGHTFTSTGMTYVGEDGIFICQPNSTILVADDEQFLVYQNGTFRALGTAAGPVTFAASGASGYIVVVMDFASFAASYTTFQNMGYTGLIFQGSPSVELLDHCVFTEGTPGGRFISIYSPGSFSITNASFPNNPGSNAYGTSAANVFREDTDGHVYLTGWSGAFGGPAYENDPFNRVWWSGSGIPPVETISISHVSATNRIQLDWAYPFSVTRFNIYRSAAPDGIYAYQGYTTNLTWSQTVPGDRYFYLVKAVGP